MFFRRKNIRHTKRRQSLGSVDFEPRMGIKIKGDQDGQGRRRHTCRQFLSLSGTWKSRKVSQKLATRLNHLKASGVGVKEERRSVATSSP